MLDFLQYLVLGLLVGGIYALAASGLTLVFGVMRIINIAHGAFLILGAFLAFTVWSKLGIDPMLAIILIAPVSFALGWVIYKVALAPRSKGADGVDRAADLRPRAGARGHNGRDLG